MKDLFRSYMLLVVALLSTVFGYAQNDKIFEEAGTLYNAGAYQEAVGKYLEIAESGQHSAALYYNIGNCYYKLNQIGPSILYYERALQLMPNDEDIQNNLAFARNMTIDAIDKLPQTGLAKIFDNYVGVMSYTSWSVLSIVLMFAFVIFFLVYYFSSVQLKKRLYFSLSMVLLIFAVLSIFFAFHQQGVENRADPAIIFAAETTVKSEPNMGSQDVFQLHEGTKVNVLEAMGEWKKIQLSDGKIGWLPSEELREVKDF
ncbi:SH3 domain-containing protein [Robertkochia solimangrovi]|uniref:SH3 domain-containing protein n=1 Tax=Robertkochia solimangrovi TaxID=2213046 RepID=UPI00117D27E7|nr:SH3 domain-containing protein [Robertkochia solimangrovi]TRZ46440.1 ion channel protein [Robertkochia solimangrovi]